MKHFFKEELFVEFQLWRNCEKNSKRILKVWLIQKQYQFSVSTISFKIEPSLGLLLQGWWRGAGTVVRKCMRTVQMSVISL